MNKPKALYIHIPFCHNICHYCDFTKFLYYKDFATTYLKRLKEELDSYHIDELDTIYVGGGTPTSLDDDLFLELLKIIDTCSQNVKEYTFEANPESLSVNKLKLMKEYGVNRISIGVETTDDEVLKNINRHHQYVDVQEAIKNVRELGFNNINVDLIIGLPGISVDQFKKDLENAISLDVDHISLYSLTVHEHTRFYIDKICEPSEDYVVEAYDYANEYLKEHGFIHYEVSNFAKLGKESLHNLTYWRNERYFGVGLSASGYIDNYRYTNTRSLSKYLKGDNEKEIEEVSFQDEMEYQIMLNLRTDEGIDLFQFQDKFGYDLYKENKKVIDEYISSGHLYLESGYLKPTHKGMMILDNIILKLV